LLAELRPLVPLSFTLSSARRKACRAPKPVPALLDISWITDHLAIGGSFSSDLVEALAGELSIKAVVDLRLEACDEIDLLRHHGIALLHLPTEDRRAVAQPMLREGVAFASRHLERGERVLIHCEHGIGRSATLALCVLVARGLEPLEALALAKRKRALVSPSPAQYEAWVSWLDRFGRESHARFEMPAFDTFAAIAYSHLRANAG
jgi:protein-tyrosine phosphatase